MVDAGRNSCSIEQEIKRLEEENRNLNLRVQGVEVLGKVLQESQDENAKLRQEVTELKKNLSESGVDLSQISLRTTPSLPQARCFLSEGEEELHSLQSLTLNEEPFEMVPIFNCPNGSEIKAEIPNPSQNWLEFHIQDITNDVRTIKDQTQYLLQQAQEMYHVIPKVTNPEQKRELSNKIAMICNSLGKSFQDVNTREKLLQGLANEEEKLKEKVQAMENEQISQEKVMNDLKVELSNYTEELQKIQGEIQQFTETEFIGKEYISLESVSSSSTEASMTSANATKAKLDSEVTVTRPSCERCFELLQQLKQTEKQKKEAERLKEEILDVNHAWDTQYKKLKSETSEKLKELQQEVEFYKTSDTMRKYEAVRNSYKKVIDDERSAKEKVLEEKRIADEKIKQLEDEVKRLSMEIREQQTMTRSAGLASYAGMQSPLSSLAVQTGQSSDLVNQVEALKQQLRIYQEDFNSERQDRERMQGEKDKLETDLKEAKDNIVFLKQQLGVYQEDFTREAEEKERLRRQLNNRDLLSENETRLGEMTRKAQAVAERQARMRALRNEYNREERLLLQEQQSLQQRYPEEGYGYRRARSEPLRPRGARPSDEMFYGGDVQADTRPRGREVQDSSRQDGLMCPHCYRCFPPQDENAFTNHIERCIE